MQILESNICRALTSLITTSRVRFDIMINYSIVFIKRIENMFYFYFVYHIYSKNVSLNHVITELAQALETTTKHLLGGGRFFSEVLGGGGLQWETAYFLSNRWWWQISLCNSGWRWIYYGWWQSFWAMVGGGGSVLGSFWWLWCIFVRGVG